MNWGKLLEGRKMALIKCSECGHDVSDKATSCPNCGCPIEVLKDGDKKCTCKKCGKEIERGKYYCEVCEQQFLENKETTDSGETCNLSNHRQVLYALKVVEYGSDGAKVIKALRTETHTKLGLGEFNKLISARASFIVCDYYDKNEALKKLNLLSDKYGITCKIVEKDIPKSTAKISIKPSETSTINDNNVKTIGNDRSNISNNSYDNKPAVKEQPKKNSGGGSSLLAWIITILILVFVFKKCSVTPTKNEGEVAEKGEDLIVYSGETCNVGNLEINYKSKDVNYIVKNDTYGLYTPESGKKYVSTTFQFKNNGNSDEYVSIYDFDCYADDVVASQAFLPGDDFMNVNLSPGRTITFTTFYEVPKNATSIELEYDVKYSWDNEKVKFIIK